jgi:hypothetical protein
MLADPVETYFLKTLANNEFIVSDSYSVSFFPEGQKNLFKLYCI